MPQFGFTYGQSLAVFLLLAEILRLGVPEGNEPGIRPGKLQCSVGAFQLAAFRLKRFEPFRKLFLAVFQHGQFSLKGTDALQPEQGLLRPVGLPRRFGSPFDQGGQSRMEALFFRFFKEVDARQLRLQRFEPGTLKHAPRVHAFRYIRIDFRARELFQNGGALIRRRLQERGEAPLCKEHGAREAFEVHSGGFFHLVGHPPDVVLEDPARSGVGKFVAGGLQFPGGFFPRPPLAPMAAERTRPRFEGDFGEAFPGLAGHDFVFAFGDAGQARRAAI